MDLRDYLRLQTIAVAVLLGALIAVTFGYTHHRNAYLELQMTHEVAMDKWTAERARLQSQVESLEIASYRRLPTVYADAGFAR
jgi:hypothetical protein